MASKKSLPTSGQLSNQEPEYVPIEVTAGIIGHIGAGIYHSVAGALKELVSNSYDADAPQVVISTDYPEFRTIKILDTGVGMTATRFRQAMRSIGSSLKGVIEPSRMTKKYSRPVIGHLGIGLMALSQICSKATIESQVEGAETKFIAEIDFSEFKNQGVEKIKMDVFRQRVRKFGNERRMRQLLRNPKTNIDTRIEIEEILDLLSKTGDELIRPEELEKEHLGYCILYPNLPAISSEHGTSIILEQVDDAVRDSLRDVGRKPEILHKHYKNDDLDWIKYREEVNSWSWKELCERLRLGTNRLTFQLLPKYHQFLWELSSMTPVQYFEEGPVTLKSPVLRDKKRELNDFSFSLLVDNRLLLKPSLLPSGQLASTELEEDYDYHLKLFNFEDEVDGNRLKYHGYIFWQRKQVQPSMIRGLQIYIRNVGIGLYDDTLMNFSTVNPASRAAQISGEVYVEEGLEQALSVNRNSFRETDAHYLALQQDIWKMLGTNNRGDGIFGKSVDAFWARKARSNQQAYREHTRDLREIVSSVSAGGFTVSFSKAENEKPYEIIDTRIVVYDNSPSWSRSAQQRYVEQRIVVLARVAVETGTNPRTLLNLLEGLLLRQT